MSSFSSTLLFIRQEWRFLIFGLLLAFWSGPGQTYVISVIGGAILRDFDLTNGEFGTLYMLATVVCAVLLWKAGPLVDRMPLPRITLRVGLLMVASLIAFGFVQGPVSLFFGIIAVRFLGQGMMTHIALTALARHYQAERGRALAFAELGFPLGLAVYPPLIAFVLGYVDWRYIWPAMSVVMAVTLLPAIIFLLPAAIKGRERRDQPVEFAAVGDGEHRTRREALRDGRFHLLMPLVMVPAAVITGFFFHQVYLVESRGWIFELWALSFSAFAIAHLSGSFSLGMLIDRFGARRLAPFILAPLAVGIVLFAFAPSQAYAVPVMLSLGFGSGAVGPALAALWAEMYGTRHLGAIRAVATVASVFGSSLGPLLMGVALDGGLSVQFIGAFSAALAVVAAILAAIALNSRFSRGRASYRK